MNNKKKASSIGLTDFELEVLRDSYLPGRERTSRGRSESTLDQVRRSANIKLYNALAGPKDSREDLVLTLHSIRFYHCAEELSRWMKSDPQHPPSTFNLPVHQVGMGRKAAEHFYKTFGLPEPSGKRLIVTPAFVPELGYALDMEWKGSNRFLFALTNRSLLSQKGSYEKIAKNISRRTQLLRLMSGIVPVDINEALRESEIKVNRGKPGLVILFPQNSGKISSSGITVPANASDTSIRPMVRSQDLIAGRSRVYIIGTQTGTIYEHIDLIPKNDHRAASPKIIVNRYIEKTRSQIVREMRALLEHDSNASLYYPNRSVYHTKVRRSIQLQANFLQSLRIPSTYPFDAVDIHVQKMDGYLTVLCYAPGVDPRYTKPFFARTWTPLAGLSPVSTESVWTDERKNIRHNGQRICDYLQKLIKHHDPVKLMKDLRSDPFGFYYALSLVMKDGNSIIQSFAAMPDITSDQIALLKEGIDILLARHIARSKPAALQLCLSVPGANIAGISLETYDSMVSLIRSSPDSVIKAVLAYAKQDLTSTLQELQSWKRPECKLIAERALHALRLDN